MRFHPGYLVLILASRSGLPSSASSRYSPNAQSAPVGAAYPCHCVVGVICPCAGVGSVMMQQPSPVVTGIPVMMVQQPVVSMAASVAQSTQPCAEKELLDKILEILVRIEGRLNTKKPGGLRGRGSDVPHGGQSYPPIGAGSELVAFASRNLANVPASKTKPGVARLVQLLTDMKRSDLVGDEVLPLLLLKDGQIGLPKLDRLIAEVDKMDMARLFSVLRWAKVRVDRTVMSEADQASLGDLIRNLEARFRVIAPAQGTAPGTQQIDFAAIRQQLDDAEKRMDKIEDVEGLKAHKKLIEAIEVGNDMWYHAGRSALIGKAQEKIEAQEAKTSERDEVVPEPPHHVPPPASPQGTSHAARQALIERVIKGGNDGGESLIKPETMLGLFETASRLLRNASERDALIIQLDKLKGLDGDLAPRQNALREKLKALTFQ